MALCEAKILTPPFFPSIWRPLKVSPKMRDAVYRKNLCPSSKVLPNPFHSFGNVSQIVRITDNQQTLYPQLPRGR